MNVLIFIAGVSGFMAVTLGAFAAHALKKRLSAEQSTTFQTGVQYQMYHTFAILAAALCQYWASPSRWLLWAGWCFVLGIVLFSGSLYLLALTRRRVFGPITPLGGLAFLTGWFLLIVGACSVV